ncbi:MAG: radical SAM protein [Desulfobacter sp.]|nr:radical SAM protein [Desulfobacter sp.]WDP84911.1 MAG: radical SAM protein [Desulfobacter sp.]
MELTRVFGPVPSRRLGRSVGINNIPPKICTYSCVYCQLGKSLDLRLDRQPFYDPGLLAAETEDKLKNARTHKEPIDYLTIVSEGEPTLDAGLGNLIDCLSPLGVKIAVITNSTLLSLGGVRRDLCRADWVSVKVDTVDEKIWRKIDRPHPKIRFNEMLDGIGLFSEAYAGTLVTETMLVKGLNDTVTSLENTAGFISGLNSGLSYISIPTRPPAMPWVQPPDPGQINQAYGLFTDQGVNAEYLIGYEGNQFAYTGDIEADILSITAVHPMREDAVSAYLEKAGGSFSDIEQLVQDNKILVSEYKGSRFYLRPLAGR